MVISADERDELAELARRPLGDRCLDLAREPEFEIGGAKVRPAVREIGERGLVRHAAGEAERVDERVLFTRVGEEAATAERRPEARVVDRDDGAQAAGRVAREVHLTVVVARHQAEDVQSSPRFCSGPGGV